MPDTGQGIDVGDAVLTFLGDTTRLDQAFDRVASEAEAKMAAAASSVGQVGDAVDDVSDRMAVGAQGAVKLGEITTLAGEKTRASMYEARGELGLLGEMFGIHLPRHVRTFVAEIPGVGAALSAAFAATAILFLIEALAKGAEKLQEWVQHAHQMALAWEEFDTAVASSSRALEDKLLQAGIRMDELKGNHVDALRKAIELIDHTSLHELEQEFGILAKAADAMFAKLKTSWYELGGDSKGAKNALDDFKSQYDLLLAEGKKKEASDLLAGTLKAAQDTQKALKAAKEEAEELNRVAAQTSATMAGVGVVASPLSNGPSKEELEAQDALVRALQQQVNVEKILKDLASDDKTIKNAEEGKRVATERASEEKRLLDQQLANIEAWRAAQHTAYELGRVDAAAWQVAELQATDAAATAHEAYLQKLVTIYTKAGEVEKAHAAKQELATLQTKNAAEETDKLAASMNRHREAILKVREEWDQLLQLNVEKDFAATQKAVESLTRAEGELTRAQTKLAENKLSQYYKDQETAITKLAAMHLITEEQKDDRLKLLEQQQANAAIAILEAQLAQEKAVVDAAQAKVTAAKNNPFFTPAQVADLEVNLKKAEIAITNTETQIVATKEKFNKQSEADDKGHYGRALLLAMAAGNELLAEQLKQNHALLLAAQAELATAKARGLNTTAIEKEISALKQNQQALEKEANGGKLLTAEKQKFIQQAILVAQAELAEAKAHGQNSTAIEKEIKDLQQLLKLLQQQPTAMKNATGAMAGFRLAWEQLGTMMKNVQNEMSQAYASAIMGALQSGKSLGAALEQATKQILENLATQALAKSIFYTAQGIADSIFNPAQASMDFAAAAEFAIVAGMAGAVGLAMPGGGNSGGGRAPGAPQVGQTQASGSGGGGSQQTVGVTHLATGGVVSKKIMIGDSPTGGDADEAILPLSDAGAMSKIVNAILPVLPQNAPGFGWATPTQRPPLGFDLSQPSSSERPDLHSGNPGDGEFERSEASMPRDMQGMEALAASFGGLLSTPTLRATAGSRTAAASAAAAVPPPGFDSNSMEKFADRISQQISQGGNVSREGDTHIHNNIKGLISPDNLKKVIKQQNRLVQNRRATVKASDSLRLTRRSQ